MLVNTLFDEWLVNKYRDKPKVADFLLSKNRRSKKTASVYSVALDHFNRFIEKNYSNNGYNYNVQTILEPLGKGKGDTDYIDVYMLFNKFISYLQNDSINGHDLTSLSKKLYVTGVRSYLQYNDIDISATKFKIKVTMPAEYHEVEQAIDAKDIQKILQKCTNRRLKAYLLVLASSGMRAVEALAIRECDINGGKGIIKNISPTQICVRKEFAKTRNERHVFISDEAAEYLKEWLEWKYRDKHATVTSTSGVREEGVGKAKNKYAKNIVRNPTSDLIFSVHTTKGNKDPHGLYFKVLIEFQKVLDVAELNGRKDDGVVHRRKITFHSFRRFVKTVIANQHNTDYSELFLGHKTSSYYTNKPDEYRKIYKDKLMKYLTFLNYPTVEATGQSYAAQLEQKETEIHAQNKEIQELKQRDTTNTEAIAKMQEQLIQLQGDLQALVTQGHQGIKSSEIQRQYVEAFVNDMAKSGALDKKQAKKWFDEQERRNKEEYGDILPPNAETTDKKFKRVVFQKQDERIMSKKKKPIK